MIVWHSPRELSDLFSAFEQVEAGQCVALSPADSTPRTSVEPPQGPGPWLGVTSSGSTGQPKLVWRRWSELKATVTFRPEHRDWLWASPYAPWTFAGVQVGLLVWLTSRRAITLTGGWDQVWESLNVQRPDALSATPTFIDLLIQNEPEPTGVPLRCDTGTDRCVGARGLQGENAVVVGPVPSPGGTVTDDLQKHPWSPIQITLGGEPLRPALGDRLRRRFPSTHFTVVYAAAEFGVLARTQRLDGHYESDSLDRHCGTWRVNDGVLEVQRVGEWRSTGDRAEVKDSLIRITGRADSVANVGGTKVNLPEIAELAEQVAGVRRAVAVAEPNAVTGQVVCLRYAVDTGCDPVCVEADLQARLREKLQKESWPRRWVRDDVAPAQNAKRAVR